MAAMDSQAPHPKGVSVTLTRMLRHSAKSNMAACMLKTADGHNLLLRVLPTRVPVPSDSTDCPHGYKDVLRVHLTHRVESWTGTVSPQQQFQLAYEMHLTKIGIDPNSHRVAWNVPVAELAGSNKQLDATLAPIVEAVRTKTRMRVCECKADMITDDGDVCYSCAAALRPVDMAKHECPICMTRSHRRTIKTPCCSQWLHRSCYDKSCATTQACPFCREPQVV